MSKRILIVDDNMFMRMMLRKMIEKQGYEIVGEAENGKEAIERYKELNPDLVTLDITMPEMSGIEALQEIMKINDKANVIICSAMGQQSMVLDAVKYGVKDFLVKPFEESRVHQAIKNVLKE